MKKVLVIATAVFALTAAAQAGRNHSSAEISIHGSWGGIHIETSSPETYCRKRCGSHPHSEVQWECTSYRAWNGRPVHKCRKVIYCDHRDNWIVGPWQVSDRHHDHHYKPYHKKYYKKHGCNTHCTSRCEYYRQKRHPHKYKYEYKNYHSGEKIGCNHSRHGFSYEHKGRDGHRYESRFSREDDRNYDHLYKAKRTVKKSHQQEPIIVLDKKRNRSDRSDQQIRRAVQNADRVHHVIRR